MEITFVGYIIIPIGLLCTILSTNCLFYSFLFFAPFSASSILNIKPITFGLQIPYYFALLWIIRLISIRLIRRIFTINKTILKLLIPMFVFWLISLISLTMPIILSHKILVHYPEDPFIFSQLDFKRSHITQFLYLTFVLLVLTFTAIYINSKQKLYNSIKVLLLSAIFVCIWGLFQFISYYFHLSYPYWIFNNNIGYSQQYNQTIFGVIHRISSVLTEPSKLAGYLLWILPFFLVFYLFYDEKRCFPLKRGFFFFRKKMILLLSSLLIIFTLIISTSTTAYIGLVFTFVIILIRGFQKRIISRLTILLTITIINIGLVILLIIKILNIDEFSLMEAMTFITTNKFITESGLERSLGGLKSIEIFLQEPLIGVGWGSNRSFDLNTTLLSNTGVLGFLLFWLFVFLILRNLEKFNLNYEDKILSITFFTSIVSGLFAKIISDPDIIDLPMWVILGLAIAFLNLKTGIKR